MSPYLSDFRAHWPNLLGAFIGIALGVTFSHYMLNLFGPALIAEFGWPKSEFALVGSLSLVSLLFLPLAGRFVDRYGPRVAAAFGFAVVPLSLLALSMMSGNILEFYAIVLFQSIFGILTTTLVFGRVIVAHFDRARGMALSIGMTGSPLAVAIIGPLIGDIIDHEGWRAGYRTVAAISAVGGFLAVMLIGFRKRKVQSAATSRADKKHAALAGRDLVAFLREPILLLLVGGMFLVNIPQIIVSSQMKLVLYESGAASSFATWLVSLYAMSVIVGRFASGYALDRIPPHIVATVSLGLPAIGLLALASPFDAKWVLIGAMGLIGMAQGAEGDIGAMLTSREFELQHYGFVYSLLLAASSAASAVGSIMLSYSLHRTESYDDFLFLAAVVTMLGVVCFYGTAYFGKPARSEGPGATGMLANSEQKTPH